jgi:predicted transposase/invertase (TIGR01784 family)
MSNPLASVHDAFFKQALSDPNLAGAFLREHLPPDVALLLGPEPPELVPGSFVDEQLRQHHSDLLFRVRLHSGGAALAYVLMEHKSSPDRGARLQLLRYVVRVLTDWYERQHELPLPAVLPLLIHQGPEGWNFSCEFSDLFGPMPETLRRYLPSFQHALVDLTRIDDRDLSKQARLRAFLKALKYSRRPDLVACLRSVLAETAGLDDADLFVILMYLDKGSVGININMIGEALEHSSPQRRERIMGCLTQPFYDKGKAEGEAKILSRLLEKRFGLVPTSVRELIFAADVGAIERWVERAFDAPDLQSVFETN